MINILPETGRDKVIREYRARLSLAIAFASAGVFVSLAVCMLPSYLAARAGETSARLEKEAAEVEKSARVETTEIPLARVEAEVSLVGTLKDAPTPSEHIRQALSARPVGIFVNGLQYQAKTKTVTLSGTARTRSVLLAFTETLRGLPGVVSVDLPVSGLAKSVDVPFSLPIVFGEKTP